MGVHALRLHASQTSFKDLISGHCLKHRTKCLHLTLKTDSLQVLQQRAAIYKPTASQLDVLLMGQFYFVTYGTALIYLLFNVPGSMPACVKSLFHTKSRWAVLSCVH